MSETIEIRDRRSGFLWIQNSFFDEYVKRLDPSSVVVYLALARLANNDSQRCYPSYETLSKMTGLARSTIALSLQELKTEGVIDWETVQGQHNIYSLLDTHPSDGPDSHPSEIRTTTRPIIGLHPSGVSDYHPSGVSDSNKTHINKTKENKTTAQTFVHPSIEDVKTYCEERKSNLDPEEFFDYYSANGWKVGRNPMKDWKASVRYWDRKRTNGGNGDSHKDAERRRRDERQAAIFREVESRGTVEDLPESLFKNAQ